MGSKGKRHRAQSTEHRAQGMGHGAWGKIEFLMPNQPAGWQVSNV